MQTFIFPPLLEEKSIVEETNTIKNASSGYGLKIYYKDSVGSESYTTIACKILRQSDNYNIINNQKGYLLFSGEDIKTEQNKKYIVIGQNGLNRDKLVDGSWYNIQLAYAQENNDRIEFSEWSSVLTLKLISLDINNCGISNNGFDFIAQIVFTPNSGEEVKKYKFSFYTNYGGEEEQLVDESNWLFPIIDSSEKVIIKNICKCTADLNKTAGRFITPIVQYITSNNFNDKLNEDTRYGSEMSSYTEGSLDLNTTFNQDSGYISIESEGSVSLTNPGNNSIFIRKIQLQRAEENGQFKTLESFSTNDEQNFEWSISFKDCFLESGVKYQYQLLIDRSDDMLVILRDVYEDNTVEGGLIKKSFTPYIEYSSLLDADSLLTLKLNDKISSYKQNNLISKQDTLGSQFPIIIKNGLTNYGEFNLSGLISLHQDNIQSFFKWIDNEGYYYKNELVIPYDKLEQGNNGEILNFDTNLTPKNFYIERIFREKVIEFLSNGQPKVFRSPSEGNKIVILSNISLTPENSLGRMLYNFSATAYEVDEYNFNNLNKYHFYEGSLSV